MSRAGVFYVSLLRIFRLESIVEAEREVRTVEVETPFFGETCVLVGVVTTLVAEQTHVCYEAEVLCQVVRDTGLEANGIRYSSVALFAAGLLPAEAETYNAVNEKVEVAGGEIGVACIGVNLDHCGLDAGLLCVAEVESTTECPVLREVVAYFRSDAESCGLHSVGLGLAEVKITTYIPLCGSTDCHYGHYSHYKKLFHRKKGLVDN